ncbi:hypothetical protein HanXRQr2_Chr10g0424651 [Helianthus annuus]|uniref:Uncharacterized protein n=1 Tax=Helianthus annuus TaxID=4232 RepID=A0A9K3N2S9_HELAN|nr:hypothetical protein HanXRQr2_Chr10g0424651 [Helianthus annuus]KAJ0528828.1 hypothetical protein HanHA89_Chr10g0370731 [Helianthus annuus]KAJ0695741.1 hypothetical protein HanLR1_Chr10g0348931 [Helianthus annuus]
MWCRQRLCRRRETSAVDGVLEDYWWCRQRLCRRRETSAVDGVLEDYWRLGLTIEVLIAHMPETKRE